MLMVIYHEYLLLNKGDSVNWMVKHAGSHLQQILIFNLLIL